DVFGDGVNIASRIQSMAEPGGINISESVYQQVRNKINLPYLSLGAPQLKNIKEAVKVYQIIVGGGKGRSQFATQWLIFKTLMRRREWKKRLSFGIPLLLFAAFLILPFDKYPGLQKFRAERFAWLDIYTLKEVEGRVAVLPFENNSKLEEYAVDGITDEVISSLGSIKGLFVLDRNAVYRYKNTEEELPKIAEDLSVRYVIKGLVRNAGDKVRITYEIYDNQKSKKTTGKLDEDFSQENILGVQERLAGSIAKELRITVTKEQQAAIAAKTQVNSKAYDFSLRGLDYLRRNTKRDNEFAMQMFEKAVTLDTTFSLGFAELAYAQWLHYSLYGSGGKTLLDQSLKNAQRAQQLNPQLGEAYRVIGAVYSMAPPLAANYTEDIDALNKAIELNTNDAISYYLLGSVYERKDLDQALNYYEQAIIRSPSNSLFYLGKGRALMKKKLVDSAITVVKEAIEYQPDQIQGYLQLGDMYLQKEEISEAEKSYRRALDLQPDNIVGYISLAKLYLQLDRVPDAVQLYRQALDKDSLNRDVYLGLGQSFLMQQKQTDAEAHFKRAIHIGQNDYRVINSVGRAYLQFGNNEKALEYFNLSIELNPNALSASGKPTVDAYEMKAFALLNLGRWTEAEVVIEKVLELSKEYPVTYGTLAMVQSSIGKPREAILTIKKYPHYLSEPELMMYLGRSYRILSEIDSALQSYKIAEELFSKRLEESPRNTVLLDFVASAYYSHGIVLEKSGKKAEAYQQYDKAEKVYTDITKENPSEISGYEEFYMLLGIVKARIGDKESALKIIQKSIKDAPENPQVQYQIAATYSILNDIPNAIKYLRKAVSLGYRQSDWVATDPDFENLHKTKEFQALLISMKKVGS
ncbi:MAG: tetratricopeptide repeat protein, partial [Ignavibacteriales bacterium]|nr:tetratricopeptide repeat protein [Ignavibacteriales bacterium]